MSANPLVAGPVDLTTPLTGTFFLEDCEGLATAIKDGDWLAGTLSTIGGAVDLAATISDPLGSLIAAGLGWVMEHLEPLKGWVNDLTGDAGQVAGFAGTWSNIAGRLDSCSTTLRSDLTMLDSQAGQFINTYRDFQIKTADHLAGVSQLASAMSVGLSIASTMVKIVHDIVRDALAEVVGSVISYAAELIFTVGLATPLVIEQVATRVSSLATRVGRHIDDLLKSLANLKPLLTRIDDLFKKLSELLAGLRHTPDVPTRPFLGRSSDELVEDLISSGRWQDPGVRPSYMDQVETGSTLFSSNFVQYYDTPTATLGRKGGVSFAMPSADADWIRSAEDAAFRTGMAPSVEKAWREGADIYRLDFPTAGIDVRTPTYADAAGNPNFVPGGSLAVQTAGGGHVLTGAREFTFAGGMPMPRGSVLSMLTSEGTWRIVRTFP